MFWGAGVVAFALYLPLIAMGESIHLRNLSPAVQIHEMTVTSLQTKWLDSFLRAATGIRSVEYAPQDIKPDFHLSIIDLPIEP